MTIQLSPDLLQGPIPGMSLTKEPGEYPWERPTQLTTVEEAVEYYTDRVLNFETEDSLLKALDSGISIERLSEMLAVSSTMNGIHNLDVGILINPYIRELMRYVAEDADVTYIDSYKEEEQKNKVPYRFIRKYLEESLEEEQQQLPEDASMMMQEETPVQKGLMARQPTPMMEEEVEELPQEMSEEGVQ
tara:strand:+ start:3213 stop:3779 length:567 start_codon:yes stop_codon:yes gene_type:complete